MNIAVCVSGAPRSGVNNRDLRRNYDNLKINFPDADFYYGSWKGYESIIEKYFRDFDVKFFDEPKIEYHPFLDIEVPDQSGKLAKAVRHAKANQKFRETSSHQTKQILAHCKLVSTLPQKYDIIVRCRYDTLTYRQAMFGQYVKDSYQNKRAIGFACLSISDSGFTKIQEQRGNNYHNHFLFDQLIIHPNELLDIDRVYKLHEEKKLIAAEYGWWQVLSGGNDHRCLCGWANPDKSVVGSFL